MKIYPLRLAWLLALLGVIAAARGHDSAPGRSASSAVRHPAANDTYTITSQLQLARPFNVEDMTDDFQDARLIARDDDSCTVEITYYPLFRPVIGENPRWREEYAGMTEYLRPTPTENWNDRMKQDLVAELRLAGIDPERLTDRQLVEQVSRWAMRRARSTKAFAVWTIHFPDGQPMIFPALRDAFRRERRDPAWTDEQMIGQEVLGRSMFYEKVHGSCTSSSVYLSTIFRALGIPTRIVFCIPPFDPNDAAQAKQFYDAIHHHQVRETVRQALAGMRGFSNHLFNEVYVGGRWVRLNYSTLGQPVLDARYFGLLTHILTTADLSQVPLAETWGMRYFRYREAQPRLSSVNPYRLIAVSDRFGPNAAVDNPPVVTAELTTATIIALLRPDSDRLPQFVADGLKSSPRRLDFLISYKEWVPGTYTQMRVFQERVGQDFVLSAANQPDLHVRLLPSRYSQGDGSFQAYGAEVVAADRDKIAAGVAYAIKPINISDTYRWQLAADLPPITLKD